MAKQNHVQLDDRSNKKHRHIFTQVFEYEDIHQ